MDVVRRFWKNDHPRSLEDYNFQHLEHVFADEVRSPMVTFKAVLHISEAWAGFGNIEGGYTEEPPLQHMPMPRMKLGAKLAFVFKVNDSVKVKAAWFHNNSATVL